ncbi:hypothetical protein ABTZ59_27090 [Streptomyces sp. NPDC094034]|uniref:hypothetical protein n=1 Tax=Streptomyces sp. NPDC094034 TaxID=3155309 RepID=UPI0033286D7A
MTTSDARRLLSLLIATFGADGALLVWKDPAGGEGAERTSRPVGDEPVGGSPEELSARVAERNKWSSRGGV